MSKNKTNYAEPIFTNETKAKLLGSTNGLPFYDKIEAMYLGFRQCYSEDVFKEVNIENLNYENMLKEAAANNPNFSVDSLQRLVYSDQTSHEVTSMRERVTKYLHMCEFIKSHMYHESPVEHANLTFWHRFSRVASHQHVRHRIGTTPSQQSQRYVKMSNPECYIPTSINNNEKAKTIYMDTIAMIFSQCQKIVDLGDKNIKDEDVRFLYPNATLTEIVTSFNFRSLLHYFEERCCARASDEIRTGANLMLKQVQTLIPFIFDDAGPKCHRLKYCPEKHGACGRYPKFKDISIAHIQKYS